MISFLSLAFATICPAIALSRLSKSFPLSRFTLGIVSIAHHISAAVNPFSASWIDWFTLSCIWSLRSSICLSNCNACSLYPNTLAFLDKLSNFTRLLYVVSASLNCLLTVSNA